MMAARTRAGALRTLAALGAVLFCAGAFAQEAAQEGGPSSTTPDIAVIATASIDSTDYRVGGAACEVMQEGGGLACAIMPTPTGVTALNAVLAGRADFALIRADTYLFETRAAREADAPTAQPVMALHDDVVTLIGRNDLPSSEASALIGRRVNIGAPETVSRALWMAIEKAIGADASRFPLQTELQAQEAGPALCEGRIDGFLWLLSHPSGATRSLLADCDAQVLSLRGPGVDTLLSERPDLRRVVIPSTLYGAKFETETIGTPSLLIAGPHVTDEEVSAVGRGLIGQIETLSQRHPSLARIDGPSMIGRGIPVPLHSAAARTYRELGLTY